MSTLLVPQPGIFAQGTRSHHHLELTVRPEVDGEEAEIYRRSTPYGTLAEHGLYFLGFSAELRRFEIMLGNMFGLGDGPRDRLTDFTTPVSGSYFFAPSVDALNEMLD